MKNLLKYSLYLIMVFAFVLTPSCTTEEAAINVPTTTDPDTGNLVILYSDEGLSSTSYFGEVFTGMDSWLLQFACDDFHLVLFLCSTQSGSFSQGMPTGTYYMIQDGYTSDDEFDFIYSSSEFSYYIYNGQTYSFEAEVINDYYDSGVEITNLGSGKYSILLDLLSTNGTQIRGDFTFTADMVDDMSTSSSSAPATRLSIDQIDQSALMIAPYMVR